MVLRVSKGDFNVLMIFLEILKFDLQWQILYIYIIFNWVFYGSFSVIIYFDIFLFGWGGVLKDVFIGGIFLEEEQINYINYFEILVCFLYFKFFVLV